MCNCFRLLSTSQFGKLQNSTLLVFAWILAPNIREEWLWGTNIPFYQLTAFTGRKHTRWAYLITNPQGTYFAVYCAFYNPAPGHQQSHHPPNGGLGWGGQSNWGLLSTLRLVHSSCKGCEHYTRIMDNFIDFFIRTFTPSRHTWWPTMTLTSLSSVTVTCAGLTFSSGMNVSQMLNNIFPRFLMSIFHYRVSSCVCVDILTQESQKRWNLSTFSRRGWVL